MSENEVSQESADQSQQLVHTPGPWQAVANDYYIQINSSAGQIGDVCASKHLDGGDNEAANARLIAAAPDLLAALEKARETIRAWHGEDLWDLYQASPEMDAINSAIEKATCSVV